MRTLLTPNQMRAVEANAYFAGKTPYELMGNAGKAVAHALIRRFGKSATAFVFAGFGDNGGDGVVASLHLAKSGWNVTLITVGTRSSFRSPHALKYFTRLQEEGKVRIFNFTSVNLGDLAKEVQAADVIVDALLGTGVVGPPRGLIADAINFINGFETPIVSIDVPSGYLQEDEDEKTWIGVIPQVVFSLHAHKYPPEQFPTAEFELLDIGIEEEFDLKVGPGDVKWLIPNRSPYTHKGKNGRLLIIAGSKRYIGAPFLSALGAVRIGVDLIRLAIPEAAHTLISKDLPELIFDPIPGEFFTPSSLTYLVPLLRWCDAFIVGPGLGDRPETTRFVEQLLEEWGHKPHIVDADAIRAVPHESESHCVITPHARELEIFSKTPTPRATSDKMNHVRKITQTFKGTILLKGHVDVICQGENCRINEMGHPALSKGGTGDLLSGLVGGLLSRGVSSFDAACVASYVLGAAGVKAAEQHGEFFTLKELASYIPSVIIEIKNAL